MKLIWQDSLIILALLFVLLAHASTVYITTSVPSLTKTATTLESNPTAQFYADSYYASFFSAFLLYGILIALYLRIREKSKRGPEYRFLLNFFVLAIFLLAINDSANDVATVLAMILK
jgi:hypothetical protein